MNNLVSDLNNFYCLPDFEFEFERDLMHREVNNSNRGAMASLTGNYYSLNIRASQFSSTTRNLVPRLKRCCKGERSGYEILTNLLGLGCSSRRGRSIMLMSSFLCFRSSW